MKSKNKIKKINLIVILFAITVIIFNVVLAKQIDNKKADPILSNYTKEKFDYFSPTEIELSVFSLTENIEVSDKSEEILNFFDKDMMEKKT